MKFFHSDNEDMDSMRFLMQTNNTCEWMWIAYRKLVLGIMASVLIISINSVILGWFIDGGIVVNHFYRPMMTSCVADFLFD